FDDSCTGAGSDNPTIWRVRNPASTDPANPPTVVTYATLPATPNGTMAFAPDGTLFAVSGDAPFNPNPPRVKGGGTNRPAPPSVIPLTGLTTDGFSLGIGATQADGSARTLLLHVSGALVTVNVTTSPPAVESTLVNGSINVGVTGPDGCLYSGTHDKVYKIT